MGGHLLSSHKHWPSHDCVVVSACSIEYRRNSHFSTQQLPNWNAQRFTLDIPKGNVQSRDGTHKDLTPSIKPMSIRRLIDILNVGRIPADESLSEIDKGAFDGLRMTLESSFTPSDDALERKSELGSALTGFPDLLWKFRPERTANAVELGRSRFW